MIKESTVGIDGCVHVSHNEETKQTRIEYYPVVKKENDSLVYSCNACYWASVKLHNLGKLNFDPPKFEYGEKSCPLCGANICWDENVLKE